MERIHVVYYPKFKRLVVHVANTEDALMEVYDNVRYVKVVESSDSSSWGKRRIFFGTAGSTKEIDIDGVEVMW